MLVALFVFSVIFFFVFIYDLVKDFKKDHKFDKISIVPMSLGLLLIVSIGSFIYVLSGPLAGLSEQLNTTQEYNYLVREIRSYGKVTSSLAFKIERYNNTLIMNRAKAKSILWLGCIPDVYEDLKLLDAESYNVPIE